MSGTLVLIPAYQAAATLPGLLAALRTAAPGLPVWVVDDGSRDATAEAARAGGAHVIVHPTNLGKGAALRTGFRAALDGGFRGVLTMDADGQHPPGPIPRFLRAAEGADLVLGNRMGQAARMPWLRRQTNRALSRWISALARRPLADSQCGYRWISRAVLEAVPLSGRRYEMESEILIRAARAGFRIAEVPVPAVYAGEASHIRKAPDTLRFLRLAAGFL